MKLATWNVNSLRVRLGQLLEWLAATRPDVLCLQETKLPDADFPVAPIEEAGYQVVYAGEKTYNGVAILSQTKASMVDAAVAGLGDTQKRLITATYGGVRVINVYVPNGQQVGSEKFSYKLQWLERLVEYVAEQLKHHLRLVLTGDFNIAPEARDVHDPQLWEGSVLFSESERQAFHALLDSGLVDVFRRFEQPRNSFTWWDYRAGAFRRDLGLRIDHILCSQALSAHCHSCSIDKTPRGWARPSDHAPVVARFRRG
ncbi:MAG: exodeoxyribonuclease III [Acidiferrobacterales bacterium]|nr:exodeoxyribonuclease III [Acidiferrobacterales bacterium]